MRSTRNVSLTLGLIIALLALAIFRRYQEAPAREVFDRHPDHLSYTRHARCRMDCRHISPAEVQEILERGIINLSKSDRTDQPCPTYALQGTTTGGERLRVIFAQCGSETKVVTCYNLDDDVTCSCPGEGRK